MKTKSVFFSLAGPDKTDQAIKAAKAFWNKGWKIYSSGGTGRFLNNAGVPVTDVGELITRSTATVFERVLRTYWAANGGQVDETLLANLPALLRQADSAFASGEMIDGRVKTLCPQVHAAFLHRSTAEHAHELAERGITQMDVLVGTLYPMRKYIDAGGDLDTIIENVDVGGRALIHALSKNWVAGKLIISDMTDLGELEVRLEENTWNATEYLRRMAAKAEAIAADYGLAYARYLSEGGYEGFIGEKVRDLAYAENPWRGRAALYRQLSGSEHPLAHKRFVQMPGAGMPSGYVNETDLNRLTVTMMLVAAGFEKNFGRQPRIILCVKHGNVCGAKVSYDLEEATYPQEIIPGAVEGDPQSLMGAFVMTNFHLSLESATVLREHQTATGSRRPLDGVIVPSIDPRAVAYLKRKDERCRIFINRALHEVGMESLHHGTYIRPVLDGFLTEGPADFVIDIKDPGLRQTRAATEQQEMDMVLAWAIGSTSNSNTITFVRNGQVLANAVGQQARVKAVALALTKAEEAGLSVEGAVCYSDSFFPRIDGVELLKENGISAILATIGGLAYKQVLDYCVDNNLILYAGPDAKIRGFYGH